ncbi:hypothetical protein QAD02_009872 [Eretmocerus hayati]|uniref:Uncharacterized protein n=1 Tax=Eretmocerus hayati TaxID=131215 RepID=A0ACC2NCY8_9HYME|nr:hypothetical protein QAD02_009872 [Eretmocerus hayati]
MKRPSEVSPTDDSDEQQQLTSTSSPPASATSLSSDLADLLNASRLSDVTLITKDKQELKAHKAILGARSPVFASMFETDMIEQNQNIVRIEDFEHEVLLEALKYIYAGTTERLDELAGEILPVAEKYDIRPLKVDCEKLLEERIDLDSCAKILVLADTCNAEGLKAAAESFIIERGGEIMKANEELQLLRSSHPHLLGDILFKLLESK